ncbi:PAS domain S-box protein [Bacillota bacterium Lsc_1132]
MNKKKLVFFYFIISFIWIFGTNYLLHMQKPSLFITFLERAKEVIYVLATGCLFFYFIKKTEELNNAQEDEKRLSTLIHSMVDFVNFKDGEGRWIEANEFGLKLFQLENVEYRGKKDSELAEYTDFYADALRYCEVSDEEAWQNGKITRIEEIVPLPNGETKTFDTIKVPLFHEDGSRKGLVIIGRDITEKKTVEKLLVESQQQYKSLFEYNPDMVFMLDLDLNVTNLNPQFEAITGYQKERFIGKNIKIMLPYRLRGEVFKHCTCVLTNHQPVTYEISVNHKSGSIITLQCTALPMMIHGKIAGIIGYGKDVTTLRHAEEQLRRAEKLSVVGELSASVAHEIRNPLTSLKGFVQILQLEDKTHQMYYQIMLDELTRINHIVGELLLLAKPQHVSFTKGNLKKILNDVLSLLNTEANLHNVQFQFQANSKELWLDCEPNQLKQLFINLIKNAIDASSSGGVVTILLEKAQHGKTSITIKDEGEGMSKERLARIGEPFYSSKEKGTGLGLTVSFKIVQSHKGTIEFESETGKGTTVKITLPLKSAQTKKGKNENAYGLKKFRTPQS